MQRRIEAVVVGVGSKFRGDGGDHNQSQRRRHALLRALGKTNFQRVAKGRRIGIALRITLGPRAFHSVLVVLVNFARLRAYRNGYVAEYGRYSGNCRFGRFACGNACSDRHADCRRHPKNKFVATTTNFRVRDEGLDAGRAPVGFVPWLSTVPQNS